MTSGHTGPAPGNDATLGGAPGGRVTDTDYCPDSTTPGKSLQAIAVQAVRVVPDLYPRLQEDPAVIERYRDCLDQLPPIALARDGILVDGFHRLEAHRLEGRESIRYQDLGDLTDEEILAESIRRNATHGHQLVDADKRQLALRLWKPGAAAELAALLSVPERTLRGWTADLRGEERRQRQQQAVALWLDCLSDREIARRLEVDHKTVAAWAGEFRQSCQNSPPQEVHWRILDEGSNLVQEAYADLVQHYTQPGDIVAAPVDAGSTVKANGRRFRPGAGQADLLIIDPPDDLGQWCGRVDTAVSQARYIAAPAELSCDALIAYHELLRHHYLPIGRVETAIRGQQPVDYVVFGTGAPVIPAGPRFSGKLAQYALYLMEGMEDGNLRRVIQDWVGFGLLWSWQGKPMPAAAQAIVDEWLGREPLEAGVA